MTKSGDMNHFHVNNNSSALFNFKQKITGKTADDDIKIIKLILPLKYLNNF